jgi:preprotein translocase subunit YajC
MNFYLCLVTALVVLLAPDGLLFPELLLAQETANTATGATAEQPASGGTGDLWLFLLMPVALVVFMMLVMKPQQKDQKQREQMLAELKKNDRVVTVGGILAKVAIVSPETKSVKLVLDEKSGSCMTVTMSSIARVLTGDEKGDLNEESK